MTTILKAKNSTKYRIDGNVYITRNGKRIVFNRFEPLRFIPVEAGYIRLKKSIRRMIKASRKANRN